MPVAPDRKARPTRGARERAQRLVRYRLIVPMLRSRQGMEVTARGVGLGVFWAFTPTLGIQTVAILVTWSILRKAFRWDSSLVQTLAWTWLNNPLTIVPIYYLCFVTGHVLLGQWATMPGYQAFADLWTSTSTDGTWTERTLAAAALLGWPTLVGCLPYCIPGGLLAHRWALRFLQQRGARQRPPGGVPSGGGLSYP
jgi:uncharacterized protein (DUF2062 family)